MTDRVQREIALPLYHQIAAIIRSRIVGGEWRNEDKIPSETQLAKTFGVSTVTIRQALDALKTAGLLEGRQGSGTFVIFGGAPEGHVAMSVPLESVALPMAGFDVELLSNDVVRAPLPERELLGLGDDDGCVRIRRRRLGTHGPVVLSTSYIPLPLGQTLTEEDLHRPLLMAALEEHGQRFTGAFQTLEASLAGPEEAEALLVPLGSALLLVRRSYEVADGTVAYVVVNRHPSGKFRYEARLTREPDGAPVGDPTDAGAPRWAIQP